MGYPKVVAMVNDLSMDTEGNTGRLTLDVKVALLDPLLITQLGFVEDFLTVEAIVYGPGSLTASHGLAWKIKSDIKTYLTGLSGSIKLDAGKEVLVVGWGDVQSTPVASYTANWNNVSPNTLPALNKTRVYQQRNVDLGQPGTQGSLTSFSWSAAMAALASADLTTYSLLAIVNQSDVDQLLTNPGFESGVGSWTVSNPGSMLINGANPGALASDTTAAQSGSKSAKVAITSNTNSSAKNVDALATDYISCVGRSTVTVSLYVMASVLTGVNPRALVAFYDPLAPSTGSSAISSADSGATTISKVNSWTKVSYSFAVPSTAAYYRAGFRVVVNASTNGTVWVDTVAAQSVELLQTSQLDNPSDLPNNGSGKVVLRLATLDARVIGDQGGTGVLPEALVGAGTVRVALGLTRVSAAPANPTSGNVDYCSLSFLP